MLEILVQSVEGEEKDKMEFDDGDEDITKASKDKSSPYFNNDIDLANSIDLNQSYT